MSRMRVDRLAVDVLVQAAVVGPLEASSWRPLTRDPDDLGRRLLGDPGYAFEPLPIGVTAVEVLKTCSFYRYNRSRAPRVLLDVEHAMYRFLPGYDDAPGAGTDRTSRPGPTARRRTATTAPEPRGPRSPTRWPPCAIGSLPRACRRHAPDSGPPRR